MKISADYLDRVLPTLLRHSGSTLQSLRLCEMYSPQDCRSDYIGDFLAYCPLLKALVVVPSYGHSYSSSNISLQDLLHADWTTAASCLETLSISISELVSAPADELDILEESLAILALLDDTQDQGDQELTLHASMVHNVTEFYKRLKALPNLKELDLLWHQSCHLVPYECGIEFSDGLLTMDNLEWMGLDWGTMYGLGTYAAQGDVRRLRILEHLHSAYKSRGDRRREQLKRRR
ncbi:hypothetical protein BGX23_003793 [Mortierella sp. AD031]|nr:hypothetical protein BGX23_003793 [Mortierella sp. AD031]